MSVVMAFTIMVLVYTSTFKVETKDEYKNTAFWAVVVIFAITVVVSIFTNM